MALTSVRQTLAKVWKRLAMAPEPRPPLVPPVRGDDDDDYQLALTEFLRLEGQQKAQHDEASKTIRRTFQGLVALCLFCAITLAGSSDINLLTPEATITLPGLNYKMGFTGFLVIGPLVLTAWVVYLHILWAEHRRSPVPVEGTAFPTLFNMPGATAKATTGFLFYWLVPITLAYFASTALPRFWEGLAATLAAAAVTAALLWLQIRRCPKKWRLLAYPALITLVLGCASLLGLTAWFAIAGESFLFRPLQLFNADLQGKDLRRANLRGAYLAEARLNSANLELADLSGANLNGANLSGADLNGANLSEADVIGAVLSEAVLSGANLSKANLRVANLRGANLSRANLFRADLHGADLRETKLGWANLNRANLFKAKLSEAVLREANLFEANLRGADLSWANLNGANLSGADLREADLRRISSIDCERLKKARNWKKAYRDGELACGAVIPGPPD